MTLIIVMLGVFALLAAVLPVVCSLRNLAVYAPPPLPSQPCAGISVLIPARDEAANIGDAVRAVLANRDVPLELIVLDDHSRDGTAEIVRALAAADPRVRLEPAPPLPPGWVGKQHACHVLAGLARHPLLLFLDADVRLAPDAVGRIAGLIEHGPAPLASGFPREETGTFAEALVVPLIHVVLLGYLPLRLMRERPDEGMGVACGQLVAARADAYWQVGGHGAIRTSLHDGLMLARAFRRAGFGTDLFDATTLARCRMYRAAAEVWAGFLKNAHEGMATWRMLPGWTAALAGGHVLPWPVLAAGLATDAPLWAMAPAALALAGTAGVRLVLARRFRQSLAGALLHPIGMTVLLAIQWTALLRRTRGAPAVWRGREYPVRPGGPG